MKGEIPRVLLITALALVVVLVLVLILVYLKGGVNNLYELAINKWVMG